MLPAGASALPCTADVTARQVAAKPGPALRFGIGPLVQAGQSGGGPAPAVPEQPARTQAALARLRPPGGPFVLRLNRFFWSDGCARLPRHVRLSDYRWFNLRDADIAAPALFQHFGPLESDYGAKPAFGVYRELVRRFSRKG